MRNKKTRYIPSRVIERIQTSTHIIDGFDCHICTERPELAQPKFFWRNEHGKKIKMLLARIVWAVEHNGFPSRGIVYSTCGNYRCVNPDHLVVGSSRDAKRLEKHPTLAYNIDPLIELDPVEKTVRQPGQCVYGDGESMCPNQAKKNIPQHDIQGLCEKHYRAYKSMKTAGYGGRPPEYVA